MDDDDDENFDLDDISEFELDVEPHLNKFMQTFSDCSDCAEEESEFMSLLLSLFIMKEVAKKVMRENHSKKEAKELIETFNQLAKEIFESSEVKKPIDIYKLN